MSHAKSAKSAKSANEPFASRKPAARLKVAPPKATSTGRENLHARDRPSGGAASCRAASPRPASGSFSPGRCDFQIAPRDRSVDGEREEDLTQSPPSPRSPPKDGANGPFALQKPAARLKVAPPKAGPQGRENPHARGRPSGGAASCRAASPRLPSGPFSSGRCDFQIAPHDRRVDGGREGGQHGTA